MPTLKVKKVPKVGKPLQEEKETPTSTPKYLPKVGEIHARTGEATPCLKMLLHAFCFFVINYCAVVAFFFYRREKKGYNYDSEVFKLYILGGTYYGTYD